MLSAFIEERHNNGDASCFSAYGSNDSFQILIMVIGRHMIGISVHFICYTVITDIYQHIFHVELKSYREILAHLISSTLRKIDGGHDFMVHVSKEDYPYVNMQKKQIMAGAVSANCNVEVVEDLTLAKNECLIEAESGIFDCGLGTQLSELKQKLMLLSWSKED